MELNLNLDRIFKRGYLSEDGTQILFEENNIFHRDLGQDHPHPTEGNLIPRFFQTFHDATKFKRQIIIWRSLFL